MFMGLEAHRLMREIESENKKRSDDERLRDEFAMAAMTGVISTCKGDTLERGVSSEQHFAIKAYQIADAMMEARK